MVRSLALAVTEGVYGGHEFTAPPRPPSDSERALNKCPNHVWPDLYFQQIGDGKEAVYVKASQILSGVGGYLVTHWEYLVEKAADPASVSTWIRVEDADRDGRPLWFIPKFQEPFVFPLHSYVGEARAKRAKDMNVEIVWSVFAAEEFSSSARFFTALCGS